MLQVDDVRTSILSPILWTSASQLLITVVTVELIVLIWVSNHELIEVQILVVGACFGDCVGDPPLSVSLPHAAPIPTIATIAAVPTAAATRRTNGLEVFIS